MEDTKRTSLPPAGARLPFPLLTLPGARRLPLLRRPSSRARAPAPWAAAVPAQLGLRVTGIAAAPGGRGATRRTRAPCPPFASHPDPLHSRALPH